MAVSLSNHCLLPHPRLSAKTLAFDSESSAVILPLRLHPNNFKLILSPIKNYIPIKRRRSFKSYASASDDSSHSSNSGGGKAEGKPLPSLIELISIYKEAILLGDKRIISEIETRLKTFETKSSELVQKVSDLSSEVTSGKEKYLRLQADFDNYRKRAEKEKLSIRNDAQGEVIESLLPMVDSFERAKQQLKPETEMEKKIDTSYQGIYKQFVEIMRSLKVAVVATVGKPFDPSLHEAIAREESQEYKEGIIIQEFRRGFLLGGRLIRPAMVKVSAGPGRSKAPVSSEPPATAAGVDDR